MSHQIFKNDIPNSLFYNFLNDISSFKNESDGEIKYYLIDNTSFKKSLFNNKLQPFLDSLEKYYHLSKKFYIKRKLNYTKFITVLRQICKKNKIPFSSTIKYDKSSYNIIYYVYNIDNLNSEELSKIKS